MWKVHEPESIISKKVMLNQNLHFFSQVQTFSYAMNISFDDLTREIYELKNHLFNLRLLTLLKFEEKPNY